MEQRRRVLVVGLALVVVLVVGVLGARVLASRRSSGGAASGGAKAAVTLADLDATVYDGQGDPVLLTEIADGRPLVINFWATWCPYCIDELPDFETVVGIYSNRVSFAFVDVCDGERETVEGAKLWLEEQGFEGLPVYYDQDLAASTAFATYGLPTTVLVAADGEILAVSAGRIDPSALCSSLEGLV